jgi:hypothetical protein
MKKQTEMACAFAFANNMIKVSSRFQHKHIQQTTWTSPDQTTKT